MQLTIAIGNTRVRAAVWAGDRLLASHAVFRDRVPQLERLLGPEFSRVAIASVVPSCRTIWHELPQTQHVKLADIPIAGLYDTLGIDRALCLWAAGVFYGFPALVVDGGTALTLTAADARPALLGGAILPGLGLQLASLHRGTAALPSVVLPECLPERWARDTAGGMQSGVLWGTVAAIAGYIDDWRSRFPQGAIVVTGGDGQRLQSYLGTGVWDDLLLLRGIAALGQHNKAVGAD